MIFFFNVRKNIVLYLTQFLLSKKEHVCVHQTIVRPFHVHKLLKTILINNSVVVLPNIPLGIPLPDNVSVLLDLPILELMAQENVSIMRMVILVFNVVLNK